MWMLIINFIKLCRCCWLLQAVCCSDKLHCCPSGTTCDVAAGTCNSNAHSMSLNALAVRIVDKQVSAREVDCPDGKQTCPDDNTCCKLSLGTYGCCPLPNVSFFSEFVAFADCICSMNNLHGWLGILLIKILFHTAGKFSVGDWHKPLLTVEIHGTCACTTRCIFFII